MACILCVSMICKLCVHDTCALHIVHALYVRCVCVCVSCVFFVFCASDMCGFHVIYIYIYMCWACYVVCYVCYAYMVDVLSNGAYVPHESLVRMLCMLSLYIMYAVYVC